MVRQYMRHGPTQAFGVVCSPTSNSFFDGRLAYVPAWEDVLVWDVKTGEQLSMWHAPGVTSRITSLLASPLPSSSSSSPNRIFAAAYEDGSIRLWSYSSSIGENGEADEVVTFNGHKKGISTLAWDADGSRLASGGVEGEIVLWDRVAEVGLFRLKGHRGAITSLHFIPHPTAPAHAGYLLSTSKDTYMKLWDLSTQHCVQTVVVGRGEVLSAAIREEASAQGKVRAEEGEGDDAEAGRIVVVTGTGDGEARVWAMEKASLAEGLVKNEVGELSKIIHPISTLPLPASSAPITQITAHPTLPLLLLQTSDKVVVALRIRPDDEVLAKLARRKKRAAEKEKEKGKKEKGKKKGGKGDAGANGNTEQGENGAGGDVEEGEVKWEDKVAVLCTVRANAKVKSFSVGPNEGLKGGVPLMLALSNNALETYLLPSPKRTKKSASADDAPTEPTKTHSIELPGHRNDVRCVAVSSDDNVIASAASGTLKIWNAKSTACIRTMECGYAVCMAFLPGDRHIVLGLKTGELALYDIATSTLMSTYRAHTGSVWGISIRPDGRGLVSGSADKDVKFWDFEMREAEGEGEKVVSRLGVETYHKHKQLTLVHVRTLKMTDDVLSVKYSPDGRLLAVALLDSTVKIFFAKDLKFFLSLYGHKLPVLGMDISGDSKLIITCSADKNIKIWGLDFGDCHKSLFAHDDSVMAVQFERGMDDEMAGGKGKGSHLFWSVGKDRALKYWDADKFELIQRLDGHHGEIWALATSQRGKFVVTGSHDKSIRIWEKTDEPLFLEEERERELEAMYDRNLADEANRATGTAGGDNLDENAEATADGGAGSVEAVTKQTSETLMAGERIIEALEIADAERSALKEWEEDKARLVAEGKDEMADALPRPPMHQELAARGELEPSEFVLQVLKKVPAAQMEDALLVLPFGLVCSLLGYVDEWAKADIETTLSTRILTYLLLTSSNQLSSTRALRTQLLDLRTHLRASLERQKALIGFNLAAMKFVKQRWESEKMAGVMDEQDEEKVRAMMGKGRAKRKRVEVRA